MVHLNKDPGNFSLDPWCSFDRSPKGIVVAWVVAVTIVNICLEVKILGLWIGTTMSCIDSIISFNGLIDDAGQHLNCERRQLWKGVVIDDEVKWDSRAIDRD